MNILSGCTRLRFNSHINHACYAARHGYRYKFDLTPRPLDSVFDHKIHSILDCPVDDAWWFWLDDDAFFTRFDTPFTELGLSFDDRKLLIFPKSPVNPSGGWTYLSSGNFFFRSTRETHAFFRKVLNTDLAEVKAWWDERTYGMFTGGDQDKIVRSLMEDERVRERTDLVRYEIFNTRPYHFSSPTGCSLVHCAVPGVAKEETIRQFQAKFDFQDDALLPPDVMAQRAAMFLPYRFPGRPESRASPLGTGGRLESRRCIRAPVPAAATTRTLPSRSARRGNMKRVLQQAALRLPGIRAIAAKRVWLGMRLRALQRVIDEPSAEARLQALRRDVGQLLRIEPLFVAQDRAGFVDASRRTHWFGRSQAFSESLAAQESGRFYLRRFCLCCNETKPMLVDYQSSRIEEDGSRRVNWRERLVCTGCGMNNRQRLVAKLVQQVAVGCVRPRIYLMEQVTPIFQWVRNLPGTEVHGSEYLGYEYKGGDRVSGIRHEDVMNLSYPDGSFDLIVSNDVMEHIPEPGRALRECFRVLRPGGTVLATFPFHVAKDATAVRAKLVGNTIEHLLAPQHHGNPVSAEGSLVFQDFGWDLFELMRGAGFSPASCEFYFSDAFGHFGPGLLVFRLVKPQSGPAA